mmetsp:Transcript_98189/g.174799  ORF Transcript_98189/g.174799 Transcript_98189/m.174799 type:complete len:201 (-) Transcript_98189:452-1054(-)
MSPSIQTWSAIQMAAMLAQDPRRPSIATQRRNGGTATGSLSSSSLMSSPWSTSTATRHQWTVLQLIPWSSSSMAHKTASFGCCSTSKSCLCILQSTGDQSRLNGSTLTTAHRQQPLPQRPLQQRSLPPHPRLPIPQPLKPRPSQQRAPPQPPTRVNMSSSLAAAVAATQTSSPSTEMQSVKGLPGSYVCLTPRSLPVLTR